MVFQHAPQQSFAFAWVAVVFAYDAVLQHYNLHKSVGAGHCGIRDSYLRQYIADAFADAYIAIEDNDDAVNYSFSNDGIAGAVMTM